MAVSFGIVFIWTFAVSLSSILAALICDITLERKYAQPITFLGYGGAYAAGFIVAFILYSFNLANDFGGIVVMSVFIWVSSLLLNTAHWSAKWFVAIMATLISNVSTFFICGPTLSFIDDAPNPYNYRTIAIFIGLKLVLFTLLFILYKAKIRGTVRKIVETMQDKMTNYMPVALVTFFGFYIINMITNTMGIIPSSITIDQIGQVVTLPDTVELRFVFIAFYGVISIIFIIEFWQMFSSVFWSSRALKTQAELTVASQIQKDMLPSTFPAFPERAEFDIYANMRPAKEVGGDFYDFFFIGEHTLAVVIADVSDKGIPAALFMVVARTLIKNSALTGGNPKEVFETVNNMLCENNETGMFVTAFLGVLDLPSGRFTYVNAGHNPPLLRASHGGSADRRFDWLESKPGFVLAGMKDMLYTQKEITLHPGDELFLYTDGVTEAMNDNNDLFSAPRLLETVNKHADLPLDKFINVINHEIDAFADGEEQSDDITMLALRVTG